MKLYGIPNCDTVKKARAWLDGQGIAYTFHDFKRQGVSSELLQAWIAQVGWEKLVNRQGTTWRKLGPERQAQVVDAASAMALLLEQPSAIKRPVLEHAGRLEVGFPAGGYAGLAP
jgi:arsenate reductase (glutaredoxin)